MNIALLAGGNSSEREIALQSAQQTLKALDKNKYDISLIDVHGHNWTYTAEDGSRWQLDKNDFSLTVAGRKKFFDYAFIMIHGTPGENGMLQGYLEMMDIPYSSCDMVSSVITFDKISCKRAVRGTGVNLAREIFLRRGDSFDAEHIVAELGLPLFVKPNASGSSCGVTKVKEVSEIAPAIEAALKESDDVLIEEFIAGRELACGAFISDNERLLFPVTEIIAKNEFFDYEAKYTAGMSEEITPADIPDKWVDALHEMTAKAYKACGCRGIVRVDFIITSEGVPYMIEINTIPGMSGGSIIPKQIAAMGLTVGEVLDKVIEATCRR